MLNEEKSSVMIVDDEMFNLHFLFNALKNEYNVITVNSGEKALQKAREENVDLILLDVVMPGMSGFDVLIKLKESNETCNIPVIFITGLRDVKDETKGLFLGASDYIGKPFNIDIVRARIKTQLQIVKQIRLIESLGMIDPLTDLANRRRFDQQLKIEWARAMRDKSPIALLLIDVDNFKKYNDTYGHPAGDNLLIILGKIFNEYARRTTDLTARIGGDEFAVLLPNSNIKAARIVGERIRTAVEETGAQYVDEEEWFITVSIGAASIIPENDNRIEELIKLCDRRLYEAKKAGRNILCYTRGL